MPQEGAGGPYFSLTTVHLGRLLGVRIVVTAEMQQSVDEIEAPARRGGRRRALWPSQRPSRWRSTSSPDNARSSGSERGKVITSVAQSWPKYTRFSRWIVLSSTRAIEMDATGRFSAIKTRSASSSDGRPVDLEVMLGVADLDLDGHRLKRFDVRDTSRARGKFRSAI